MRALVKTIWDYTVSMQPLSRSDVMIALGSHDLRVAMHAAYLMRLNLSPTVVASGGGGKITNGTLQQTEADWYAETMMGLGVSHDRILLEPTATNTGENITRSKDLLAGLGVRPRTGILVAKPYMTRRALHTAEAQWPSVRWQATGPPIAFESYVFDSSAEQTINLMVGDLQRMWVYAARGFQSPAE